MPKRILIVDDEKEYTRLFHQMLEPLDCEIVELSFGSQVYARLLEEPFDLILLDYKMRDERGDMVCDNIRGDAKLKDIPIIIVTAYYDLDEAFFKAMGANDVLYKPVNQGDLMEMVQKYLK